MGTSLKILTSFVAMASTWNDLPRFGANAMSWTASVTVISVSALAYFLFTIENKKKIITNLQNNFKSDMQTTQQDYLPCVFIILIDLNFPTVRYVTVVTPHCKHWRVGARAGWWGEKAWGYTDLQPPRTDQFYHYPHPDIGIWCTILKACFFIPAAMSQGYVFFSVNVV